MQVHWVEHTYCKYTKPDYTHIVIWSEQEGRGEQEQEQVVCTNNEIQELQNRIMEVLRQSPYMGEKIPVR